MPLATGSHPPGGTLNELGVADLIGVQLLDRIEHIFDRNEITPSIAADEMAPIAERVRRLETALDEVLSSFAFFADRARSLRRETLRSDSSFPATRCTTD